ncbi:hydroxyacid dehydrogenase [Gemmatimonadota bacterium]
MGHRIFLTGSGIAEEACSVLREHGCILEVGDPKDTPLDLARKLKAFNPNGIIVRQGEISAVVQAAAEDLKVICKHGVGTDNIDILSATRRGIPVFFTPGANSESAAEHTVGLMLSLLRRIPVQNMRIRGGTFDKKGYDGAELQGKTLGLIGFGRIGRRVAELVRPFNVQVLAYDPLLPSVTFPPHVSRVRDPGGIFHRSDVISLHCPLTEETRSLINEEALSQMKEGVYLINTARGGIIDEDALVQALREGRVAGAALDVFEMEPLPVEHPLLTLDSVVLTTHVAGVSDDSFRNMGMQAVRNVLAVLEGRDVDRASLLNPEALGETP